MDIDGFKKFLEARKLGEEAIEACVAALQDFEAYLKEKGKEIETVSRNDFYDYSNHLIYLGRNTLDNYLSILRYGRFNKFNRLIVAGLEVLDGSEVMENFSRRLIDEYGEDFRDEIFQDISVPPLGLNPREKPIYTEKLIQRLETKLGTEGCGRFLNQGLRDRYEESRKPDREKFLESKNIDEFLKQKHIDFVAELETHLKNGTLFFTQEITRKVVDYVRNGPHIECGVREGDKIIIEKIPHMAKEYFAETNEQKKRYYYCHCPWVKEAFKESSSPVPAVFCNCSAGFYRAYWEIVFDQPVQVDVLQSLMKGDSICGFAIHIPKNVIVDLS